MDRNEMGRRGTCMDLERRQLLNNSIAPGERRWTEPGARAVAARAERALELLAMHPELLDRMAAG